MKTMGQKINDFLAQHPEHEQRIHRELYLLRASPVEDFYSLKEKGHLFFPAYMDLSGFLVLYVLRLNPVNPLDFGLDVNETFEDEQYPSSDFTFYTSLNSDFYGLEPHLERLSILEDYRNICVSLNTTLEEITERIVKQSDMSPFLEKLLAEAAISAEESAWLDNPTLQVLATYSFHGPMSYNDLIQRINKAYQEAHKQFKVEKFQIAGIFMDVLLLAWKWWFRELGQVVLYPRVDSKSEE